MIIEFNLNILSFILIEGPDQNLQLDVNKIYLNFIKNGEEKQTLEFTVRNIVLLKGIKRKNDHKKEEDSLHGVNMQNYLMGKNLSMDSPFITSPISF